MRKLVQFVLASLKLLILGVIGLLLITFRYILRTPQPLETALPGESHIYKWTHGHIFYKVLGEVSAPPLVLFHSPEIGSSSYEMRNIMEGLAQRYHVYALDLLGFGLSDHPDINYTADIYPALYRDFLSDIVKQPATLLASGLSCNYSVALAASTPALCKHLILLSPIAVFEDKPQQSWLVQLAGSPIASFSFVALSLYAILTLRIVLRRVVIQQQGRHYEHVSNEELDYISAAAHQLGAHHAALASIAGKLHLDVSLQIETIQQPTLIIWGVQALHHAQSIAGRHGMSPHTQVVLIQNAGIRVQEERPAKVVANILEWQPALQPAPTNAVAAVASVTIADTTTSPTGAEGTKLTSGATTEAERSTSAEVTPVPVESAQPAHETATGEEVTTTEEIEAYCMRCRVKRVIDNAHKVVTKSGRSAIEGTCPVCGTKLFRFVAR
jgi:pimeloyl-ACP methyl ester carboxylesterase